MARLRVIDRVPLERQVRIAYYPELRRVTITRIRRKPGRVRGASFVGALTKPGPAALNGSIWLHQGNPPGSHWFWRALLEIGATRKTIVQQATREGTVMHGSVGDFIQVTRRLARG